MLTITNDKSNSDVAATNGSARLAENFHVIRLRHHVAGGLGRRRKLDRDFLAVEFDTGCVADRGGQQLALFPFEFSFYLIAN